MKIDIKKLAKEDAILKTMVSDLLGGFREIIFPISVIEELVSVGIAYDGSSFRGINNINSSDAILKGVEGTIIKCPENIADSHKDEYWIICNILGTDGKAHPNCARSKLVEMQEKLSKTWKGGKMYMGSEPEAFFVSKEDSENNMGVAVGGNKNYFNPKDPKSPIIVEIQETISQMGFVVERAHTEVGEDQFETNWRFDLAEKTADRIQMYKLIAHKVARNYGYDVTFLPKPYPSRNGSGMHCHISVQTEKENLFYSSEKKNKNFSDEALYFITGILENSRQMAVISNRAEVSYSRLVPGFEAPCIIAIGEYNRSASCRIPAIASESLKKKAIRVEFRFPDPLANPYLLGATFIALGIEGIESKAKFKGFTDENLYEFSLKEIQKKGFKLLPRNLWEAYGEFENSKILKKQLGESIFESYKELILDEIDTCQPFANRESVRIHYFD